MDDLDTPQESYYREDDVPRVSAGVRYCMHAPPHPMHYFQVPQSTWKLHGVLLTLSSSFLPKTSFRNKSNSLLETLLSLIFTAQLMTLAQLPVRAMQAVSGIWSL